MKIFKYLLIVSFFGFFTGCIEPEDKVTANAKEAGIVLQNNSASGKVLGAPNEDNSVTFQDVALDYTITAYSGDPSSIASYRVVKSYVSADTTTNLTASTDVGTFTELPFTVSYDDISGFLQDLDGVTENSLRIGDTFTFTTFVTTTSGEEFQVSPGMASLTVPVNCLSDLAGMYSALGQSSDAGVNNQEWQAEVFEIGPGEYYMIPMSAWLVSRGYAIAIQFSDVCGEITVPAQSLGADIEASSHQFSNDVVGEGSVDPVTGVITLKYSISGFLGGQETVLTPID